MKQCTSSPQKLSWLNWTLEAEATYLTASSCLEFSFSSLRGILCTIQQRLWVCAGGCYWSQYDRAHNHGCNHRRIRSCQMRPNRNIPSLQRHLCKHRNKEIRKIPDSYIRITNVYYQISFMCIFITTLRLVTYSIAALV